MPGIDLGAIKVAIVAENAKALSAVEKTGKAIDNMAKKSKKSLDDVAKNFSKIGSNMSKYVTAPILAAAAASIKLASDMQETISKVDVVFGDSADEVKSWADTAIESFGQAKGTALEAASTFGDMATGMGLSTDEAAKMSMSMVKLTGDLASFKNISVERAQVALQGVFTGEGEALKSLGVIMTDANLKAYAMTQGITKQWEELSQAEKVQLRYQYVMQQTANAQGDFARTSDSAANQSRTFIEKLKQLGTQFGEKLLPVVTDVLEKLNGLLDSFLNADESTQQAILWSLGVVAAIGPVTKAIGSVLDGIGKVKAAFEAGTLTTATLGWIAGGLAIVASIGATVVLTKQHLDEIYADSNALNSAMSKLGTEMISIQSTYQSSIEDIESTSKLAEDYITQLEALEKTGLKTNEQQKQYAAIVQKLKSVIPGLNIEIDKQTGKIIGGANAIRQQTQAWKDQAILEALLTKQKAQVDALTDAQIALTEAERKSRDNAEQLAQNRERLAEVESQLFNALEMTKEQYDALSNQQQSALWQNQAADVQALRVEYNNLNGATSELANGQAALETSVGSATLQVAAANAELDRTTQVYTEAYDAMANTDAATAGTEAVVGGLNGVASAASAAAKDVKDFSSDVSNMTKNLKEEADITMKEATANLKANTELYNNLWVNIGNLMKRGVSQDFLFHLQQMGPEGWAIIDQMNKSSDKKLQEFVGIVGANAEASKKSWETEIGKIPDDTATAFTDAKTEATTGGKNVGNALGAGMGTGISEKIASIAAWARSLVQAAIKAAKEAAGIKSPSRVMKNEVGKPMAQGIGVGFDDEVENTVKTIKKGTSNIILGSVSATQKTALNGSSGVAKHVTVNQNNTFTTPTQSPYAVMLEQEKFSKNILKGV